LSFEPGEQVLNGAVRVLRGPDGDGEVPGEEAAGTFEHDAGGEEDDALGEGGE